MTMHRYGDSLWQRFLRWLMPADGLHAKPEETGELPVIEADYEEEREPWRSSQFTDTRYDMPAVPMVRPYYHKAA